MSQALAGTAYVHVDGRNYSLVGTLTYRLSGTNNEPLTGLDGYHGHKEAYMPGQIKGTFRNTPDTDIAAINAIKNATVTLELANGKVVTGRNMMRSGEPITVSGDDATFDAEFVGPDVREL